MRIKRAILGGAASAALLFGSLLGPAAYAAAATGTGSGSTAVVDQTCNAARQQLSSDRAQLRAWQIQRQEDASRGLDTSFDDSQIAFYQAAVNQDLQEIRNLGC